MRTLKFIGEGQLLKKDPDCNFDNLVPGTENYIRLEFTFSEEWRGRAKVAGFWSMMGKEYEPQMLKDGKSCDVPVEALKKRAFKFQIGGVSGEGEKIITNKLTITQNGGSI